MSKSEVLPDGQVRRVGNSKRFPIVLSKMWDSHSTLNRSSPYPPV
jgi:hypothetical protein